MTLDESHIFVVPPVLEVKIFDPCRQLVLSLWVFVELKWLCESVLCQALLHPFSIFMKATVLSVLSLPPTEVSPIAHL